MDKTEEKSKFAMIFLTTKYYLRILQAKIGKGSRVEPGKRKSM